MIYARLAALCVAAVLISGCTTSRAVRAWHAGVAAEDAGKFRKARRKYDESYGRNGALVGAELARLRLLARLPESRKKAADQLKKLLEDKPDHPRLLLFAAWWALLDGQVNVAAERLAAVPLEGKRSGKKKRLRGAELAELRASATALKKRIKVERARKARAKDSKAATARRNNKLAVKALAAKDPQRAVSLLEATVALDPDPHWVIHHNLGVAWLQVGRQDKARAAFRYALQGCGQDCSATRKNLATLGD